MDAIVWALVFIGVGFTHCCASEIDRHAIAFWAAHFESLFFCADIAKRDHKAVLTRFGQPDLYFAGFPCQPFSIAGLGDGIKAAAGTVILHIINFIELARPTCFILENVEGLVTQHPELLQWILQKLQAIGHNCYHIYAKVLNAADSGIPHHRKRLWIVGIMAARTVCSFTWPESIGCLPMMLFLEPLLRPVTLHDRPPDSQGVALRNWMDTIRAIIKATKQHPFTQAVVGELDGSSINWMLDMSPCLTRARAGSSGHWVFCRGRRQSTSEMLWLMGMSMNYIDTSVVSERQLRLLIGNSCSVNVLERILLRALSSSGLAPASAMKRRWESLAQAKESVRELRSPS